MLKAADRISNMISLGLVTDREFVRRYTEETERCIYPIARGVNLGMLAELEALTALRRRCLDGKGEPAGRPTGHNRCGGL